MYLNIDFLVTFTCSQRNSNQSNYFWFEIGTLWFVHYNAILHVKVQRFQFSRCFKSLKIDLQGSTKDINTDPTKKSFKLKLFRIKFATKKSAGMVLHLLWRWRCGASHIQNSWNWSFDPSLKLPSFTLMENGELRTLNFL